MGILKMKLIQSILFFTDKNGIRWYRTGDVVSVVNNKIFYKGRIDLQVKWNGYRIELEEINKHIRDLIESPEVYSVFLKEQTETFRPGIYTVISKQLEWKVPEIFNQLKNRIPSYMIPQKIIGMDEFPINKNGKIDFQIIKEFIFQ